MNSIRPKKSVNRHSDESIRAISHLPDRIRKKLGGVEPPPLHPCCHADLNDFSPLPKPRGGDWLSENPRELSGQPYGTFVQRAIGMNAIPSKSRNTLYLQPFDAASVVAEETYEGTRRKRGKEVEAVQPETWPRHPPHIAELASRDYHKPRGPFLQFLAQFLEAYFGPGMRVVVLPYHRIKEVTCRANSWEGCSGAKTCESAAAKKRLYKMYGAENRWRGCRQLDASELINRHLPRIAGRPGPHVAYAVMGITSDDLYSGSATRPNHYVGGSTDMMGRVGLFSFARSLDVDHMEDNGTDICEESKTGLPPPVVLQRALKVTSHELCHTFGHQHCVHFNCVMRGMNHIREYESVFHDLCPVCLNKLLFMTGLDPVLRYHRLKECIDELISQHGPTYEGVFGEWSRFYQRRIDAAGGIGAET